MDGMEGGGRAASNRLLSDEIREFLIFLLDDGTKIRDFLSLLDDGMHDGWVRARSRCELQKMKRILFSFFCCSFHI